MLIKLAAPAAEASGTQSAAITYFSWRGQQCARSYAVPAQPRTGLQSQIRSAFTDAQSGWAALSTSLQAAWNAYASTHPTTDRLGRPIRQTGRNAFCQINWWQSLLGNPKVTEPSNVVIPAAPSSLTSVSTTAGNLVFVVAHPQAQGSNFSLTVEAWIAPTLGYATSNGRETFVARNVTQSIAAIQDGDSSTTLTVAAGNVNPYLGAPADGKRIFVRTRIIETNNGGFSAPMSANTLLL